MISLTRLEDLFKDDAAVPKGSLEHDVLKDLRTSGLISSVEDKIDISFQSQEAGGIINRVVDPQEAAGYLVFKDETEYNGWLKQSLYEPSQEEMMEAVSG